MKTHRDLHFSAPSTRISWDNMPVKGVSDMPPVEELINLAIEIFPALRNVGVIYNSGEVNSLKTMEKLEQILKNKNIGQPQLEY